MYHNLTAKKSHQAVRKIRGLEMEENQFGDQAPPDLLYCTDNPVAGFYGRNRFRALKGGGDFPIQSEFPDPPLTRYDTIR